MIGTVKKNIQYEDTNLVGWSRVFFSMVILGRWPYESISEEKSDGSIFFPFDLVYKKNSSKLIKEKNIGIIDFLNKSFYK